MKMRIKVFKFLLSVRSIQSNIQLKNMFYAPAFA